MIAGFGFRREADLASLRDALRRTGVDTTVVTALATAEAKAEAPAFRALAVEMGCDGLGVSPQVMHQQSVTTHSNISKNTYEVGSVSEAAALAAAGPGARLLGPRVISGDRMATCAIALPAALPDTPKTTPATEAP